MVSETRISTYTVYLCTSHSTRKKDLAIKMNIQAEKLEIFKLILETDNPGILDSIRKLLKKEYTEDFWNTLTEDQKQEILEGIGEIERGEVVDYEDFMKKYR
jgi:hypothetical protein